ncbi:MAG: hypothetical protein ACFFBI_10190 [Promethearchaeota archaeon]
MEKSKTINIETPEILNEIKVEPFANKEKVGNKLDSLWNNKSSQEGKIKNETKKLVIKFETTGKERRKISLKLESNSSIIHPNNYDLLSELFKEFFRVESNQK